MRVSNDSSSLRRDHSAFDSELSGAVLNIQLFVRIMHWLKPYKIMLFISLILVLIASCLTVIMELSLIHI